ncbi:MAG: hypothetical protein V2A55_01615, partial [Candidatus Jorgensenbacteria bacterium]
DKGPLGKVAGSIIEVKFSWIPLEVLGTKNFNEIFMLGTGGNKPNQLLFTNMTRSISNKTDF